MSSLYIPCPRCGKEIEVEMRYSPPEWDTDTPETWETENFTPSCNCALTAAEDHAVADQAVQRANTDPEFGATLTIYDEGGW